MIVFTVFCLSGHRVSPLVRKGSKETSVTEKVPSYILIFLFKVVGIYLTTRVQLFEA